MFVEFLVALQFLTIVQLRPTLPFDEVVLGRAGVFFPVVGFLLGATVWALDQSLLLFFPASLANVFVIVALAGLTRGLHLDGVADSADGLWGGADRQHRLAIMKDSRLGTFGALALLGIVLTKLRALDLLQGDGRGNALLLSPMFGRWACVVMASLAPPAREDGLGALFVRNVQRRELIFASVFTLFAGFCFAGAVNVLLFGVLVGIAVGVTRYCTRRLGGVTGDTLGAVGELVETAAFCAFCVFGGPASGGGR
jgi:adenosylcobinamide-GDP ribazoletransferase